MNIAGIKAIIININEHDIHCRLKYTHPTITCRIFDRLEGVTCRAAYFLPAYMHVLTKNAHFNSK